MYNITHVDNHYPKVQTGTWASSEAAPPLQLAQSSSAWELNRWVETDVLGLGYSCMQLEPNRYDSRIHGVEAGPWLLSNQGLLLWRVPTKGPFARHTTLTTTLAEQDIYNSQVQFNVPGPGNHTTKKYWRRGWNRGIERIWDLTRTNAHNR